MPGTGTTDSASKLENQKIYNPDLSPLIPEPVERMQIAPIVSVTPAPAKIPVRPTQLDLNAPKRPQRLLRPNSAAVEISSQLSIAAGSLFCIESSKGLLAVDTNFHVRLTFYHEPNSRF